MELTIQKLTPALAEDYVDFFDRTPHDDNLDEHKCYCLCWSSADHRGGVEHLATAAQRRTAAAQYVRQGLLQGYLAYHNGRAVGWCNANTKADCLHCESWLRFMQSVGTDGPEADGRVKSIFCFVIAPEYRRMGVARHLLEQVCADAAQDGFQYVEAYPNRSFIDEASDFRGPLALFTGAGFASCGEVEGIFEHVFISV